MSSKQKLLLDDFDHVKMWTFDDEADDGSLVPLQVRFFDSGELDATAVFVKGQVRLADGTIRQAVLGLSDREEMIDGYINYQWEIYFLSFFNEREELDVNLAWDLGRDPEESRICDFFERKRLEVFPMHVELELEPLRWKLEQTIE